MSTLGNTNSTSGYHVPRLLAGEVTTGLVVSTNTGVVNNGLMRLYQFVIHEPMTLTLIGCEVVTTPGGAGSVTRLGIYGDNNGVPGDLILDAGTVDTTTTGVKQLAISQAVPAGSIYCCAVTQGAPSTAPTYRLMNLGAGQVKFPVASITGNMTRTSYIQSGVTGALPTTPTVTISNQQPPIVIIGR
jgi:hypothetical protein